jgi:lipooligosaccharide transport system ATP-binding protein
MTALGIKIEKVSKTYNSLKAVDQLSFEVDLGKCFGLLGPNGAGKSTMMHMIYGRCRRDNPKPGQINVFGYDPLENELEIKFLSGIVPQENNLDLELTALQNLLLYAKFYGLKKKNALSRIDSLLEFMELTEKKEAKIRELSGGMQRRLVIARALINSPSLLILDEPTTGLDPQVRHLIWDKLRMLKNEGVTILLTTHYMEEAFQICDKMMIMHNGQEILMGNPAGLIRENIEPFVLEVLSPDKFISSSSHNNYRMEKTYGRLLLYSDDFKALSRITDEFQAGEYLLRPANLEDLFLKTTGRNLNE